MCVRARVCVLVRFLNVTRKKVEKAIQKDAVALNHKLVHLPEEFFFIFFLCGMPFCNILKYIVAVSILYILRRAPDDYSC